MRFPSITKKVVLRAALADILLSSILICVSWYAFNRQFYCQYNSSIQEIAEAARDFLNPDDFEKYLVTKQPDEVHAQVLDDLQKLVDNFDLNVIYVSAVQAPEYTHIFYFYDPVNKHGKWSPYPLGYEEDYFEPSYHRTTKRVYEEKISLVRHTIKSRVGSHVTAQIPVFDSKGEIVALLGAQKNIQEFVDARKSFVTFVVIASTIFTAIFAALFSIYFNFTYIKPVIAITRETNRFSSERGKPSDALLAVKNRDELGNLAHSVYQMEDIVSRSIDGLTKITEETALALATAIDAKDKYTHGHSSRVAEYSREIARISGKSEAECKDIYLYALLHDVGKIGIPDSIINKTGRLTDEEYTLIKAHPVIGKQILSNISQAPGICDGAYYHHERYDGKGYPEGLSGKNIPDIGRIIAVADAYDAMTSNRSYRGTLSQEFVRNEIQNGIGTQFDPEYAKIMIGLIDADKDYKMRES